MASSSRVWGPLQTVSWARPPYRKVSSVCNAAPAHHGPCYTDVAAASTKLSLFDRRQGSTSTRTRNAAARRCQAGTSSGASSRSIEPDKSSFLGTRLHAAQNICLGRAIIFKTCLAAWPGANGNGYSYDSRIPPQPNYIAFPLPTPPIDAQFLPNTALRNQQQTYYQQQQAPFYPPPMSTPQQQQPVGVFWDIENSTIPKGARVGAVVRRIRAVAQQFGRVRSLKAYGKLDVIEHYIDDLVAAGVEVLPVPDGKEMADKAIITDALLFALDSIDQPGGSTQRGAVIIASGDKGFASVLGKLSARGIQTVMLARRRTQRGGRIPTVITNSVDYTYDWEDLVPDGLRDVSQEPALSTPPRKPVPPASPPSAKARTTTAPPPNSAVNAMPMWKPLSAQESMNGKSKKKTAAKVDATPLPDIALPRENRDEGIVAVPPVKEAKGPMKSRYILEKLRSLAMDGDDEEDRASETLVEMERQQAERERKADKERKAAEEEQRAERRKFEKEREVARQLKETRLHVEKQQEEERLRLEKQQEEQKLGLESNRGLDQASESGGVEEDESSDADEDLDTMEPLTEIRGAPRSHGGMGSLSWPRWKTPLQQKSKKKARSSSQPKAQPKKPPPKTRESVLWNPLELDAPEETEPVESVTSPFAFLPLAEKMLNARTPLKGSVVADRALEMLQSALQAQDKPPVLAAGRLEKRLVAGVTADPSQQQKSAEMLAAAREKLAKVAAERGKKEAKTDSRAAQVHTTASGAGSDDDKREASDSTRPLASEPASDRPQERPKLTDAVLRLAAQTSASKEVLAGAMIAALAKGASDVSSSDGNGQSIGAVLAESTTESQVPGGVADGPGADVSKAEDVSDVSFARLKNQLRLVLHQEGPCAFTSLPGKYSKVVGHPLRLAEFGFKKLQDISTFDDVMGVSISFLDPSKAPTEEREAAAKERQVFLRESPRNRQLLALITSGLRNLLYELLLDSGRGGKSVGSLVYWITVCTGAGMEAFLLAHGYLPQKGLSRSDQEDATHRLLIDMLDVVRLEYGISERFKNVKVFLQEGAEPDPGQPSPRGERVPYKAPDPPVEYCASGVTPPKLPVPRRKPKSSADAKSKEQERADFDQAEVAQVAAESSGLTEKADGRRTGGQVGWDSAGDGVAERGAEKVRGKSLDTEEVTSSGSDGHGGTAAQQEEASGSEADSVRVHAGQQKGSPQIAREDPNIPLEAADGSAASPGDSAPLEESENLDPPRSVEMGSAGPSKLRQGSSGIGNESHLSADSLAPHEATSEAPSNQLPQSPVDSSSDEPGSSSEEPATATARSSVSFDPIEAARRNWELFKPPDVIDLRSTARKKGATADKRGAQSDVSDVGDAAFAGDGERPVDPANEGGNVAAERREMGGDVTAVNGPDALGIDTTPTDDRSQSEGVLGQGEERIRDDAGESTAEEGSDGESTAQVGSDSESTATMSTDEEDESASGGKSEEELAAAYVMRRRWRMFNHDVMMLAAAGAGEKGLSVEGLLTRYEEVYGRPVDMDLLRTRDGVPTTLQKRLAMIGDVTGVGENALAIKKRRRTLQKQLAVASGLRQVFWTVLADAYPRRLSFDELVAATLERLPGHTAESLLKQHTYTDAVQSLKGLVLDNCDFVMRRNNTCTILIEDPPPLLRDARLLGISPGDLHLPLLDNLEQQGLRGEGEGPLYSWLEQCEWAPEWLDLVVGWFQAAEKGSKADSAVGSVATFDDDEGEAFGDESAEQWDGGGLTEIREYGATWGEDAAEEEYPESFGVGAEDEAAPGNTELEGRDARAVEGTSDGHLSETDSVSDAALGVDVNGDDADEDLKDADVDEEEADEDGDADVAISKIRVGDLKNDVTGGFAEGSQELDEGEDITADGNVDSVEPGALTGEVTWEEAVARQEAAQVRHELLLVMGSLQAGAHPQGVTHAKLKKVYRSRTGKELPLSLEDLLSDERLLRRPHFECTGLLTIRMDAHSRLRLNAAKSGLRQVLWWIAQQAHPEPVSSDAIERQFAALCSLDLGTCLELHGLRPQEKNRFKGWAALGAIKELIWEVGPGQSVPGDWVPLPVHLWKASPPPMLKDPRLLGLTPSEMEFELLKQVKEDSGVSCWRLTHPTMGARSWRREYKKVVKKWKKARHAGGARGVEREGLPRGGLRGRHGGLYESEDDSDGGGYGVGSADQIRTRDDDLEYELKERGRERESRGWEEGASRERYESDSDGAEDLSLGYEELPLEMKDSQESLRAENLDAHDSEDDVAYDDGSDADLWRSVREDRLASLDDAESDLDDEFEAPGGYEDLGRTGRGEREGGEYHTGEEEWLEAGRAGEMRDRDHFSGGGQERERFQGGGEEEDVDLGLGEEEDEEGDEEGGLRWRKLAATGSRWDSDQDEDDDVTADVVDRKEEWHDADSDFDEDQETPRGGPWAAAHGGPVEAEFHFQGGQPDGGMEPTWARTESETDVSDGEEGRQVENGVARGRVNREWLGDESESDDDLEDSEEEDTWTEREDAPAQHGSGLKSDAHEPTEGTEGRGQGFRGPEPVALSGPPLEVPIAMARQYVGPDWVETEVDDDDSAFRLRARGTDFEDVESQDTWPNADVTELYPGEDGSTIDVLPPGNAPAVVADGGRRDSEQPGDNGVGPQEATWNAAVDAADETLFVGYAGESKKRDSSSVNAPAVVLISEESATGGGQAAEPSTSGSASNEVARPYTGPRFFDEWHQPTL